MQPSAGIIAVAVLVVLLCLRRVRVSEAKRGGAEDAERDAEECRAQDAAFSHYNNLNDLV
jgi:hypothetical protein